MRFRHRDGSTVHLAYCSNVHPAEDVDGIVGQLARFAGPVREVLDTPLLGVGLWLSAAAAATMRSDAGALQGLRNALLAQQLEVVTLNGFPYRSFHAPVVKRDVYRPDWSDPARTAYTLDLAWVLAALLPADVQSGSISTLPLGWRTTWTPESDAAACSAFARLADGLAELEDETGRRIRVGFEPEPGCVVETTRQAIQALRHADLKWLGVCLDACHLAVQFEEPNEAVRSLADAGVAVVKSQVSNALRILEPRSSAAASFLADFIEPRFLHQTRERAGAGQIVGVDDLVDAMAGKLPREGEWRIHFHVPVHADGGDTTQPELLATLAALLDGPAPVTRHLEVETYTWTVLPSDGRPIDDAGLVAGIARELDWTRDRLTELGLKETTP